MLQLAASVCQYLGKTMTILKLGVDSLYYIAQGILSVTVLEYDQFSTEVVRYQVIFLSGNRGVKKPQS